jgi:hypothetical protein
VRKKSFHKGKGQVKMSRKTTQLSPNTKTRLKDVQEHLRLKNESQVISYLLSLYTLKYPKITMPEHELCLEQMNELENQGSLL